VSADTWRLEDIYPDSAAWEREMAALSQRPAELAGFRGRLAVGPGMLVECLAAYHDTLKQLYRASSYASMRHHEDTRIGDTAELEQRARMVGTAIAEAASFIDPEILAIGEETVRGWIAATPELSDYAHGLDDLLRRAPHTLSPTEEEIVATAGLITDAPYSVYGMLANADLPWPTIQLSDGAEVRLDQSEYARLRTSSNRPDREAVFRSFWGTWSGYTRTFGATLYAQVKKDLFNARVRKYPSSLAAALDGDRIPQTVYRTLVRESNAGLPVLHRYFGLRARMLGLDRLEYFDIYPPLVTSDRKFGIDEAKSVVLEAVDVLGPEARSVIANGFGDRWMDVYPRPGKRSGAYMSGHVYDVHPYVLMNFTDDFRSVSTLAHEWGHALHSCLANRTQPFANAGYSIFTAEVASTFVEALLLDRMLSHAATKQERIFFLGHALEGLRGTFFRQTMFAEFELAIHEAVEQGEALSGDRLTAMYADLVRRYHGHDAQVVNVDDEFTVEWAYIPHFYYNFYVYQYATSVAASALLAEQVLSGDEGASRRFLDLLRAGGSDYAYDLMVGAGVDLAEADPYRALLRRMEGIMDEIETLLDD